MDKLIICLVLALFAETAWAKSSTRIDEEVNSALLDRYGVAVMIEATDEDSIPANHRIYQLLVGKLQREMRKADILVFNGVLPESVSEDGFDRAKLKDTISALDNPYLDTVLLITAKVLAGPDFELQLTLQFVDATTGLSFAALDESSTVTMASNCDSDCWASTVNRQVISTGRLLSSKAIVAMRFENNGDDYQMASSR